MCKKPAEEHPEHTWVMTKAGWDLLTEWEEKNEKRDQDNYGLCIYNRFSAYGCAEVIQIMVRGAFPGIMPSRF